MNTYDITISHHEKIRASSLEEARNKFYHSKFFYPVNHYAKNGFLDSILKISRQMTIDEINENRMQFGADERRTALGRKFALRTIESINRSAASLTERSHASEGLDMVQKSLDKWLDSVKPDENWIDEKFRTEDEYDLEGEVNQSASEEELSA